MVKKFQVQKNGEMGHFSDPQTFIQIWSEPLEPLLPALDSGLDSAWVKARLDLAQDRCSARDSMTLHDLARSSARLGSRSGPARYSGYCSSRWGAGGSGDCSRSTDSVVIGWWAISAASPSPWPSLEQGESSTSGRSLVK